MFVTLQLWCESSGVGVWQQQWSPAQWSPSFCCFWTDVRPQSSPVWAEPVWEYWTEWSANLDLEYLLDGAGQGETKGDGKIETLQSFFFHCCCQMHCSMILVSNSSSSHLFSCFSDLFTGSVDERSVSVNPLLRFWWNSLCCSDGSLHFCQLVGRSKG